MGRSSLYQRFFTAEAIVAKSSLAAFCGRQDGNTVAKLIDKGCVLRLLMCFR